MKLGIKVGSHGIGDKVVFASFPENWFKATGEKVIDLDEAWCYDHNPYVSRGEAPDRVVDFFELENAYDGELIHSVAHRVCRSMGIPCKVRHPRLYQLEDAEPDPRQVLVHVTGRTTGSIPTRVCEHIRQAYSRRRVEQIGVASDRDGGFGQRIHPPGPWDLAREIALSGLFIGVPSGPMNVANCYPRIPKKIILSSDVWTLEAIERFFPLSNQNVLHHWYDHNCQYYNCTDEDIGVTYSFRKI
jgi:hypothetical protein